MLPLQPETSQLEGHPENLCALVALGPDSVDPIGDGGSEVDGCQEVSGKVVVASCDTPEILEPAETALDKIAPSVGAFA